MDFNFKEYTGKVNWNPKPVKTHRFMPGIKCEDCGTWNKAGSTKCKVGHSFFVEGEKDNKYF